MIRVDGEIGCVEEKAKRKRMKMSNGRRRRNRIRGK